jgi:hypothetical protein
LPLDESSGAGQYEHWVAKLKVFAQTRKVLGKKRNGYWEPARALTRDGMTALGPLHEKEKGYRTAERWNPVARSALYINFKAEFSAFDRFFYFEDGQTLEEKQDNRPEGGQAGHLHRCFKAE